MVCDFDLKAVGRWVVVDRGRSRGTAVAVTITIMIWVGLN